MALAAGRLRERVTFQEATVTRDGHGGEIEAWGDVYSCRAEVRFGTAAERREQAQEQSSQAITLLVRACSNIAALTTKNRAVLNGMVLDIISFAPAGADGTEITTMRSE
ncbi:MAG: phage head closure protein [Sphingomonas sp.]